MSEYKWNEKRSQYQSIQDGQGRFQTLNTVSERDPTLLKHNPSFLIVLGQGKYFHIEKNSFSEKIFFFLKNRFRLFSCRGLTFHSRHRGPPAIPQWMSYIRW